jgi:hypothetical protein
MGKRQVLLGNKALQYPSAEGKAGSHSENYPLARATMLVIMTIVCVTSAGTSAGVARTMLMLSFAMWIVLVMMMGTITVFVLMMAVRVLVITSTSPILFMMRVTMLIHNSESM